MINILSIEYKNGVADLINNHLKDKNIKVDLICDINQMIFLNFDKYNFILVDMSHHKRIEILKQIKYITDIPIFYIVDNKDFMWIKHTPNEKISAIRSLTRSEIVNFISNIANQYKNKNVIRYKNLIIDQDNKLFRVNNKILNLTKTETSICMLLIKNMGEAISTDLIVKELFSWNSISTSDNSVREHIRKIRLKLKKHGLSPIETLHGKGYKRLILNDK